MPKLPSNHCLSAAIATPVTPDLRPDAPRLVAFARHLFTQGVDGVTIFGTTGEGPEFGAADRMRTLDALVASGIDPQQIIVSVSALAFEDSVALTRHAANAGVAGCLLMPPCMFRSGITDDGVFDYYRQVIERVDHPEPRLFIYNFPDICGVTISLHLLRRLTERFPRVIAGVKDSGGDPDLTRDFILSFAGLAVFTGNEIDVPDLNPLGLAGTVCGLANIMPGFMRRVVDSRNAYAGRPLVAALREADAILSRFPFIPAAKAIIADRMDDPAWLRLMPPMAQPPAPQRARMVADYNRWQASARHAEPAGDQMPADRTVRPIRIA